MAILFIHGWQSVPVGVKPNRVVFVICKEQNLTKSHGRYLESCGIQMAPVPDTAFLHYEYELPKDGH